MSTWYSVGQMNQLGDALEGAGFTPDDVTKLRTSPLLKDIKQVLLGFSEIKVVKFVIDLDADPFVPDCWDVEEHQKGGTFEWNRDNVQLYLTTPQTLREPIGGTTLRNMLKGKPVFNACLLDYLLVHPYLIPDAWKEKYIFFWGTIYRDACNNLCVRCLIWDASSCQWGSRRLQNEDWGGNIPAALHVS